MLVGFKIRNHPQQVAVRGASDTVDERITPHKIFREFHHRFSFTLDVAANERNRKTDAYFSIEDNGLEQPWAPHSVWCNPPYSNIGPWVEKAHREFAAGCRAIVLLLPANRMEQPWWQRYVEPHRDRGGPMRTEFLAGRFNFGVPGNEDGKFKTSAPFGCVAVIFDRR
jgi:phage N-6-adenine-methyltransferase